MEKEEDEQQCWISVTEIGQWLQTRTVFNEPVFSTLLFLFFSAILFFTMNCCELCVFGVMMCSLFLCFQFRVFNILLFACLCVLWGWGWRFGNDKGLSLTWK